MMKILLIGIFLLALASCETKQYKKYDSPKFVTNGANLFGSDLDFGGIDSVTSVTSTSAIINWTEIDDAVEYYIYDATGGAYSYLDRVEAPANSYALTKLKSGETYTFMVRVKDSDAQLDNNLAQITITTKSQPDAPSFLLPASTGEQVTLESDVKAEPTILVFGISPGDIVTLYSDSTCSTQVGSLEEESEFSFAYVTVNTLSDFGNYDFYAKTTNINGIDSPCSTAFTEYEYVQCPAGYLYIEVDFGNDYVANDFCVMQFEAKAWQDNTDTGVPDANDTYDADGCDVGGCDVENWGTTNYKPGSFEGIAGTTRNPWRSLDMQTAKDECRSLGVGYDLINVYEWMYLAQDIESIDSNWSGGVVGSGCLFRGNMGINDTCGYDYTTVDGRAATSRDPDTTELGAALTLSSGELIWDFAGNLAEWVDFGDNEQDAVQLGPENCPDEWSEYGSGVLCDIEPDGEYDLNPIFYAPANPGNITTALYNSDYGLGQFEGGQGGAPLRGGSYRNGIYAGVFSLSFSLNETIGLEDIGFRCVFRPHQRDDDDIF